MRIEGVLSPQLVHGSQRNVMENKPHNELIKDKAMDIPTNITNENREKKVVKEELIKAIESANKSVNVYDRKLEFSIHEKTNEIMVKVIDTNTDEVIREIPPEKTLDMVAKLWELAGILIDKKV